MTSGLRFGAGAWLDWVPSRYAVLGTGLLYRLGAAGLPDGPAFVIRLGLAL
jgi:hypothetical protein